MENYYFQKRTNNHSNKYKSQSSSSFIITIKVEVARVFRLLTHRPSTRLELKFLKTMSPLLESSTQSSKTKTKRMVMMKPQTKAQSSWKIRIKAETLMVDMLHNSPGQSLLSNFIALMIKILNLQKRMKISRTAIQMTMVTQLVMVKTTCRT